MCKFEKLRPTPCYFCLSLVKAPDPKPSEVSVGISFVLIHMPVCVALQTHLLRRFPVAGMWRSGMSLHPSKSQSPTVCNIDMKLMNRYVVFIRIPEYIHVVFSNSPEANYLLAMISVSIK